MQIEVHSKPSLRVDRVAKEERRFGWEQGDQIGRIFAQ
jgi:hypothetical protein